MGRDGEVCLTLWGEEADRREKGRGGEGRRVGGRVEDWTPPPVCI